MKRLTKIAWNTDAGQELLVLKDKNEFYIPLSTVNEATLRELGRAISDALSDELVRAVEQARKLET